MYTGKERDEWYRAGAIMAVIYNMNRDSKSTRPKGAEDFVPKHFRYKNVSIRTPKPDYYITHDQAAKIICGK